jgi:hypothetical protein
MPSIATKFQYVNSPFLFFLLTHYMFRPLRAILRWYIQFDVSKDYSYYNGSVVCTQLDVCLHWYFDPWSPIHVIKLSIKVVKTLKFTVKLVSYIKYKKCKNVKISRWMGIYILLWWSGQSSNLFGLLVDQRRLDWAVGSGGPFLTPVIVLLFCLFFLAGMLSMLEMQMKFMREYTLSKTFVPQLSIPV